MSDLTRFDKFTIAIVSIAVVFMVVHLLVWQLGG